MQLFLLFGRLACYMQHTDEEDERDNPEHPAIESKRIEATRFKVLRQKLGAEVGSDTR